MNFVPHIPGSRGKGSQRSRTRKESKDVFISYLHEDSEAVQKLHRCLADRGIAAWLDRNDIQPGARWKRVIRQAIEDGAYFVGCFSRSYMERGSSYMNEELMIAIDRIRKMPLDRRWFIPVLLEPCEVPDLEISSSETLRDLQKIRLYADWDRGLRSLFQCIESDESVPHSPLAEGIVGRRRLRVLFLGCNPPGTARIEIDRELREVQSGILTSQAQVTLELTVRLESNLDAIRDVILREEFDIIHFSGIGTEKGMVFLGSDGSPAFLTPAALRGVFEAYQREVECVVFNMSRAADLASAVINSARCVVSMSGNLADPAAISFAAGFYKSLGDGVDIVEAFDRGCSMVELEAFSEEALPTLLTRRGP